MSNFEQNDKERTVKNKPLGVHVVASVDLVVILAPVLLLLVILFFENIFENAWSRPEWSFVTVFLLIEVLKDQIVRQSRERYELQQSEAGVVFYALFLVLGVLILSLDFRHSLGTSTLDANYYYTIKFSMFGFAILAFYYHRVRKIKLINSIRIKTIKERLQDFLVCLKAKTRKVIHR